MKPTRYAVPDEVETEALRNRAHKRRKAMEEAVCQTYELGLRGGQQAICCLCCGLGSSNLYDVQERYCGFCRRHHSEEKMEFFTA